MIYRSAVTVLEPAASYDLATLEAVKAYFNIAIVTGDPGDARLQQLITFQSKVIADYCDRVFALEKVSEVIYTEGLDDIVSPIAVSLTRWPVVKIDSVTLAGNTLASGTDYRLDSDSGTLRGNLIGDQLEVVYEAGYDLPQDAPGPLASAVIEMVRQSFFYGSRDPMVQSMTDNSAGSIRFFPPPGIGRSGGGGGASSGSKPSWAGLVSPYRRPGMA